MLTLPYTKSGTMLIKTNFLVCSTRMGAKPGFGENWRLVKDELVEFEK